MAVVDDLDALAAARGLARLGLAARLALAGTTDLLPELDRELRGLRVVVVVRVDAVVVLHEDLDEALSQRRRELGRGTKRDERVLVGRRNAVSC